MPAKIAAGRVGEGLSAPCQCCISLHFKFIHKNGLLENDHLINNNNNNKHHSSDTCNYIINDLNKNNRININNKTHNINNNNNGTIFNNSSNNIRHNKNTINPPHTSVRDLVTYRDNKHHNYCDKSRRTSIR